MSNIENKMNKVIKRTIWKQVREQLGENSTKFKKKIRERSRKNFAQKLNNDLKKIGEYSRQQVEE